ncbi:transcription repressor NadR [Tuberibacillus sp. Marseille-P3662]|uniref:transcription repressor NadR n=1 Tax=Tuberibacillus sp. Marseille-P3662 TaxID=1965358 RepID=UPI00111C45E0
MMTKDKIYGEKRRALILQWLEESEEPLTGGDLSDRTNVSRQVIVQDISLLKAKNHPIIATSQGYLYMPTRIEPTASRVIAVKHTPDETAHELNTIVDHGVTIRNVVVEHAIYGEITGSLMLQSRKDVSQFLKKLAEQEASLLSDLTGGVHLHTLEASSESVLDEVIAALKKEGYLL